MAISQFIYPSDEGMVIDLFDSPVSSSGLYLIRAYLGANSGVYTDYLRKIGRLDVGVGYGAEEYSIQIEESRTIYGMNNAVSCNAFLYVPDGRAIARVWRSPFAMDFEWYFSVSAVPIP